MPAMSTYEEATSWLFQQFPSYQQIGSKAYKPTLENTLKITEFLGNPHDGLTIIHVAGSNGKGSVCSMLASILTEAGYRVGLFTSPHIKDYRERIRVNGECIDEQSVIDFVNQVQQASFEFEPSFFEMTFGLALKHFEHEKCDICILETGLGGRLDATNIVSPILSIITSISLEHTAILGDTLEQIALEKAGIIKSTGPVIANDRNQNVQGILREAALSKSTTLLTPANKGSSFNLPLLGNYQKDNLQLVLEAINYLNTLDFNVTRDQVQSGLNNISLNTGYHGRLQLVSESPTIIYDVSHNPEGMAASISAVEKQKEGDLHIVFGTSADKDIAGAIKALPKGSRIYFTEFENERSVKLEELRKLSVGKNWRSAHYFNSATDALKAAKDKANKEDTILVIGSFFLISDFF